MNMFARVSKYRTGPDNSGKPSDETVKQVLDLPGCSGIYYLLGDDSMSLSITLWESAEDVAASRGPADRIQAETSAEQHLEILEVKEFEVLTRQLKA
jgi:heme-degrading monooxygenase HmoA